MYFYHHSSWNFDLCHPVYRAPGVSRGGLFSYIEGEKCVLSMNVSYHRSLTYNSHQARAPLCWHSPAIRGEGKTVNMEAFLWSKYLGMGTTDQREEAEKEEVSRDSDDYRRQPAVGSILSKMSPNKVLGLDASCAII